jgi:predicted ATPase
VLKEDVEFSGKPIFRFENGEVHLFNDRHEDKVQYPFDWHRSALATISERKDNTKLSWLKQWFGGLLCISPDPRQMTGVASQEAKNPDQNLAHFADWYRHLRQEMDDHAFLEDLRQILPGFVSMRLEHAGERRREIKIRMAGKDEYLLSELSDGQRVLIGLYAVLHFTPSNPTLCFDAPDNFIALREVQPWLDRVLDRTEADPPGQVFIASHHPELLNQMAFKSGLSLFRPDGRQARAERFSDPSETGLTAAELVARGWENE